MLPFVQSMQNWAWIPGHVGADPDRAVARPRRPPGRLGTCLRRARRRWSRVDGDRLPLHQPVPVADGDPIMPLAIKDESVAAETVLDIDTWLDGWSSSCSARSAGADLARRWRDGDRRPAARTGLVGDRCGPDDRLVRAARPAGRTGPTGCPAEFTPLMHLGSQLFFPAALLVAVLGQQLWGLRLAVDRTVAWSLLTALLIAGYVGLVGLSGLLVPGVDDGVGRVVVTALIAAADRARAAVRATQGRPPRARRIARADPRRRPCRSRHRPPHVAHRVARRCARRSRDLAAAQWGLDRA